MCRLGRLQVQQRVDREVLLATRDTTSDDAEELSVEVLLDADALVRCEDTDLVNLARIHEHSRLVRVSVSLVADIAVIGRVRLLRVPVRAAAVHVVGEQHLNRGLEPHVGRASPA